MAIAYRININMVNDSWLCHGSGRNIIDELILVFNHALRCEQMIDIFVCNNDKILN